MPVSKLGSIIRKEDRSHSCKGRNPENAAPGRLVACPHLQAHRVPHFLLDTDGYQGSWQSSMAIKFEFRISNLSIQAKLCYWLIPPVSSRIYGQRSARLHGSIRFAGITKSLFNAHNPAQRLRLLDNLLFVQLLESWAALNYTVCISVSPGADNTVVLDKKQSFIGPSFKHNDIQP